MTHPRGSSCLLWALIFVSWPEPHHGSSEPVTEGDLIRVATNRYYFGAEVGQSQELRYARQDVFGVDSRKSLIFCVRRRINFGALR